MKEQIKIWFTQLRLSGEKTSSIAPELMDYSSINS